VAAGIVCSIVLMGASLAMALALLSPEFAAVLVLYVAITVAYSLYLKRKLMVDVIVLGVLYALRVFIGGVAVDVAISPWLLAFSIFFFLSLAFVKRYADLAHMAPDATEKLGGRGYFAQDLDLVRVLGPLAGYMSVMVLALYVSSPHVRDLYASPEWLWMVCLTLLYWISRIWFLAHRGQMPDDPVLFALKDGISQLVGLATGAFVLLATVT
jgi:4-hydroxybenzoate polyprenyltransferase